MSNTHFLFIGYPQGPFEQVPPVAPPTAPMAGQPVIPLSAAPQPPSYAQPPPFLVPPPQFMSPQAAPPNIINFVSGPNGPPFQPNFQGYQGYTPTSVPVRLSAYFYSTILLFCDRKDCKMIIIAVIMKK